MSRAHSLVKHVWITPVTHNSSWKLRGFKSGVLYICCMRLREGTSCLSWKRQRLLTQTLRISNVREDDFFSVTNPGLPCLIKFTTYSIAGLEKQSEAISPHNSLMHIDTALANKKGVDLCNIVVDLLRLLVGHCRSVDPSG